LMLWLLFCGVANRRSRRTNAVGVGPVKMNQMLFGFWDVDEHARDKLKWVDRLAVVDIVASFGLINKEPRFGMITKSRQIHWRALQVASEAMESFSVAGINGGVIVNGET